MFFISNIHLYCITTIYKYTLECLAYIIGNLQVGCFFSHVNTSKTPVNQNKTVQQNCVQAQQTNGIHAVTGKSCHSFDTQQFNSSRLAAILFVTVTPGYIPEIPPTLLLRACFPTIAPTRTFSKYYDKSPSLLGHFRQLSLYILGNRKSYSLSFVEFMLAGIARTEIQIGTSGLISSIIYEQRYYFQDTVHTLKLQ